MGQQFLHAKAFSRFARRPLVWNFREDCQRQGVPPLVIGVCLYCNIRDIHGPYRRHDSAIALPLPKPRRQLCG